MQGDAWVFVSHGRIEDDDGSREVVDVTAIAKPDQNMITLNIDYYDVDMEQDFHESVDLPIDAFLEIAEELKRRKELMGNG